MYNNNNTGVLDFDNNRSLAQLLPIKREFSIFLTNYKPGLFFGESVILLETLPGAGKESFCDHMLPNILCLYMKKI